MHGVEFRTQDIRSGYGTPYDVEIDARDLLDVYCMPSISDKAFVRF